MSLKKNVIANYLGQGWTALMGIAFVPLYIKYLGMEAFGLIGVFTIIQAWLSLMDLGITATLSREMARFTAGAHTVKSIRDLLRSLEVIGIAIAIFIALLLWMLSGWLGVHWLQADKLSSTEVVQAISMMGLIVALRFVESIYRGAMLGLQRQVWMNVVNSTLATIRGAGGVAVLAWYSPTISAFFSWQIMISVVAALAMGISVHRILPRANQPVRFSWAPIGKVWRFAGGMMATTFLVLLLTQVDKILLSRLLSLDMFGYYMLAATVANSLYQLMVPVSQAIYPRFTELATVGDTAALSAAFHRSAQTISVLVMPSALLLFFFGSDILKLWTGSETIALQSAPLLALLSVGTMFNVLMNIPYQLTLAYGWVSFAVRMNIIAVLILAPAILWATQSYGAIGAAWIWAILNAGYLIVAVHFIHRRLLVQEKWTWYTESVIQPLLAASAAGAVCWYLHPSGSGIVLEVVWIAGSGLAMFVACALSIPYFRSRARDALHSLFLPAQAN